MFWPYKLTHGHSADPVNGACVLDAVNWLVHGEHGDAPPCVCPVIAGTAIWLNDSFNDEQRQRLIPFMPRIAGSRGGVGAVRRRVNALLNTYVLQGKIPVRGDKLETFVGFIDNDRSVVNFLEPRVMNRGLPREDIAADATLYGATNPRMLDGLIGLAEVDVPLTNHSVIRVVITATRTKGLPPTSDRWDACMRAVGPQLLGQRSRNPKLIARDEPDRLLDFLDLLLSLGPEGEPWSADAIQAGVLRYSEASGLPIPA
jgi:hypothetical protein